MEGVGGGGGTATVGPIEGIGFIKREGCVSYPKGSNGEGRMYYTDESMYIKYLLYSIVN